MTAKDGSKYIRTTCAACGSHKAVRGAGIWDFIKSNAKEAAKALAPLAVSGARSLLPAVAARLSQHTGDERVGNLANALGNMALNSTGHGLLRRKKKTGGSFLMSGAGKRRSAGGRLASGWS